MMLFLNFEVLRKTEMNDYCRGSVFNVQTEWPLCYISSDFISRLHIYTLRTNCEITLNIYFWIGKAKVERMTKKEKPKKNTKTNTEAGRTVESEHMWA